MLSSKTRGMLNVLLYPVTFSSAPDEGVEWVIEWMMTGANADFTKGEVLACIDEILPQSGWASEVAAMGSQTDETVKQFFRRSNAELRVNRHIDPSLSS